MIEIKHLKKSFGEKTILNDVNLVMDTGKCNLIIGSSGSGKTVLLKCIVGLFSPDDGEVIYDGQSMTGLSVQDRKVLRQQIGMLFQGSALFDSMTVEQNIKFPLDMFTDLKHRDKLQKVNEVLARVNMEGANNKFPAEISGGMKKELVLHGLLFLIQNIFFAMSLTQVLIRKHRWLLINSSRILLSNLT